MTEEPSALEVIEELAQAINRHDVDAIMKKLHEAHVFVDSMGHEVSGGQAIREAWERYLSMVPDYWLRIDHGVLAPEYIALFGRAGGTLAVDGKVKKENEFEATAAWRAVVIDGRVARWEVYADNEPIRALLRKPRKKTAKRKFRTRKKK